MLMRNKDITITKEKLQFANIHFLTSYNINNKLYSENNIDYKLSDKSELFGELNNKNKQKNFAEEVIEKLLTRKSSIKIGFFHF